MESLKTAHLEQFKAFGSQGLLVLTLTAVKSYILSVMGKKNPKQKSSLKPPPVQVPISKRFMINQVDYALCPDRINVPTGFPSKSFRGTGQKRTTPLATVQKNAQKQNLEAKPQIPLGKVRKVRRLCTHCIPLHNGWVERRPKICYDLVVYVFIFVHVSLIYLFFLNLPLTFAPFSGWSLLKS